ncbi:MRPS18 [Auxenochlorella protothecoides x Auxenochlorella symbiontica]
MRLSTLPPGEDSNSSQSLPTSEAEPAQTSSKSWREWADGQLDDLNKGAATEASSSQGGVQASPPSESCLRRDAAPEASVDAASGTSSGEAAADSSGPALRPAGVQQQQTGGRPLDELLPGRGAARHATAKGKGKGPATLDRAGIMEVMAQSRPTPAPGRPEGEFASYGLLAQATDAPRAVFGNKAEEQSPSRVHPFRLFYPGQTYSPEDLDPYQAAPPEFGRSVTRQPPAIPAKVVLARADFRDAAFLSSFITDTGRIVPRRRTKLSAKLHKHVARQIKTARAMGILRADAAPARPWVQRGSQ